MPSFTFLSAVVPTQHGVKYLDRLNDLTDYTEAARLQSSVAGLRA